MRKSLIVCVLLCVIFCGCTTSVKIHPIDREDFIEIPVGTVLMGITTKEDGCFLSNYYIKEVLNAKVEGK